jgi:hypothetical protein
MWAADDISCLTSLYKGQIFWLFVFSADESNSVFQQIVFFGNSEHFMSVHMLPLAPFSNETFPAGPLDRVQVVMPVVLPRRRT